MSRSRKLLPIALLLASSALAAPPTITSVTPNTGRVAGNEEVTIRGTGFDNSAVVEFGGAVAHDIHVIDATTITAKTPAHLPGATFVRVNQPTSGSGSAPFTFTGATSDAFERFLLPVYTGPVKGAFGSEFHTEFHAANTGFNSQIVPVHGLMYNCIILCPPLDPANDPIPIKPSEAFDDRNAILDGTPGRFLYVPKQAARDLGLYLRVFDVTREAANYGTELRVVRERDFTNSEPMLFPRVPVDPRFRITLRIYSAAPAFAFVTFNGEAHVVELRKPRNDLFTPAYATFTNFPVNVTNGAMDITVAPPDPLEPPPLLYPPAIWAFLTITNNDTQQITTMHPN
ncbi:MAG TPA: IPT/TIG domain-containing protein [Thermoanaerobaculia bacterium]|nr:IPT/TIG domain-containing protein [Thermoanaerobaculia bacterium]